MAQSVIDIKLIAKDLASGTIKAVKTSMSSIGDGLKGALSVTKSAVGSIVNEIKRIAIAAGTSIAALGGLALKSAADFESMEAALTTAFQGNQEAAQAAQKTITQFASKTPYQLDEVMRGFIKLKNMGLDPSEEALRAYGDTASAMGKNLNDMVEAVADATTGEFERLKEFGIRASSEGDRVKFTFQGMTTEVGKNSAEIEKYLINLGKTKFTGGMEAQSKTLRGLLSTLKDNVNLTLSAIAKNSGLLDFAKRGVIAMSALTEGIKDAFTKNEDELTGFAKTIRQVIDSVVSFIRSTWPQVKTIINGIMDQIKSNWDSIYKPIFNAIIETVKSVVSFISSNWPTIQSIISTVFSTIGTLVTTILIPLFRQIVEWAKQVVQIFIDNWPRISQVVSHVVELVKQIWNTLWPVIKTGIDLIIAAIEFLLPKILNIINFFFQLKDNVIGTVSSLVSGIVDFFTKLPGRLFTLVWQALDTVILAFRQLPGHVLGQVSHIFDGIVGIFGNIVQRAIGFGADFMGGILGGIQKVASGIKNAVSNILDNVFGRDKSPIPQVSISGAAQLVGGSFAARAGAFQLGNAALGFAKGGIVPYYAAKGMFTPKGTDTVPAMLTPGEFVVDRATTDGLMGFLKRVPQVLSGNNQSQVINLTVNYSGSGDSVDAARVGQIVYDEFTKLMLRSNQRTNMGLNNGI